MNAIGHGSFPVEAMNAMTGGHLRLMQKECRQGSHFRHQDGSREYIKVADSCLLLQLERGELAAQTAAVRAAHGAWADCTACADCADCATSSRPAHQSAHVCTGRRLIEPQAHLRQDRQQMVEHIALDAFVLCPCSDGGET